MKPTVGSHWADNKIWMLGRVVKVVAVDATHATVEVTKDQDSGSPGHEVPLRSQVGKEHRIKLSKFRPFDRPLHGGFLPASGPLDGRTSILLHHEVHPIRRRGIAPTKLLQLKYVNGWTVKVAATGEVVDYSPRHKGDGRAWRASDGTRYPSTKCEAEFPPGMKIYFGETTETEATTFPTSDWFKLAHVMVSDKEWYASCGVRVSYLLFPSDVHGLNDDLSAVTAMCEVCEAKNAAAVMASRVETRLTDWCGVESTAADGTFDTAELDQL